MRSGVTAYGDGRLLAVPALRKDGGQISIEFSIQLLKAPDRQVDWVVAVLRDVTERFEREKALRATADRSRGRSALEPPPAR